MSKFFDNFRDRVKNIPNLIVKRFVNVSILGDSLIFELPPVMKHQTIKQFIEDLVLKIDDVIVFDANAYPYDFDVKLDNETYPNKELLEIYDKSLNIGDKPGLIVPNRPSVSPGFHKVIIATHSAGVKASFNKHVSLVPEEMKIPKPQMAKKELYRKCSYCGKKSSDPNQTICEYCGYDLNKD